MDMPQQIGRGGGTGEKNVADEQMRNSIELLVTEQEVTQVALSYTYMLFSLHSTFHPCKTTAKVRQKSTDQSYLSTMLISDETFLNSILILLSCAQTVKLL